MNLGQRLFYYLGGFLIGLILLFFFLGGKNTSCDYAPNSRVLKNIKIKERKYSEAALKNLRKYSMDTSDISSILRDGNVDFSKSITDNDSCNLYYIYGNGKNNFIELLIENCDSIATIKSIENVTN